MRDVGWVGVVGHGQRGRGEISGRSGPRRCSRWRPSSAGRPRWGSSSNITAATCRWTCCANDCGVSRDGSNAFYIKEAAKQYGLETKAFRKPADGLATKPPPIIVLWQWNHFLVVEGFGRGKVYLNDPASGRRTVSREEFARFYSGIAFTFTPGPGFVRQGRRPSVVLGLARRLATSRAALAFVILAGLALMIPTLVAAAYPAGLHRRDPRPGPDRTGSSRC